MKCTDIEYIRAVNGRSISSIKMRKRPVYAKENVRKDKKKHELWNKFPKISKTPIAKTYLAKLAYSLRDFNNPYLEIGSKKLHF